MSRIAVTAGADAGSRLEPSAEQVRTAPVPDLQTIFGESDDGIVG